MTIEITRALIISFIAGFSTIIGALIVIIIRKKSSKLIAASLGFGGGVMLSVSFLDLYPEATRLISLFTNDKLGIILSVLFVVIGIALAGLIDHFVPHQEYNKETGEKPHQDLFRVGFVSMIAIALHNFPEGIATFMASYGDYALGLSIGIAIAFHNIPEGIAVAMPIYISTGSKKKALFYTFITGILEPLGAIITFLILMPFINDLILGSLFSIIAGIMIYITIEELIPSSRQYGADRIALIATLIGICIMPFTHLFL